MKQAGEQWSWARPQRTARPVVGMGCILVLEKHNMYKYTNACRPQALLLLLHVIRAPVFLTSLGWDLVRGSYTSRLWLIQNNANLVS
jgi:hypothetical protein